MDASLQNLDKLNIDDDLQKINNNEQQTSNQNGQQTSNQNEQQTSNQNEQQTSNQNEQQTSNQNEQQTSNQNEQINPKKNEIKKEITLEEAIKMYMQNNKLLIVIGTPCYGSMLHLGYFRSITKLCEVFTLLGIPYKIQTVGNESLIPRARNGIVATFMNIPEATHLMFIDADITFDWRSIVKLIILDKDLSGGCYPKKSINWDKVKHQLKKEPGIDNNLLIAKSVDYVFNPIYFKDGDNVFCNVNNGMVKVRDIGTGFMCIKRCVFEILINKHRELKYINNVAGYVNDNNKQVNNYFYNLFDTEIDPETKIYLSEDYLFCKRWINCGGECWLDLSINLNHTGVMDFKGCLNLSIGEMDNLNQDLKALQNADQDFKKLQNIEKN